MNTTRAFNCYFFKCTLGDTLPNKNCSIHHEYSKWYNPHWDFLIEVPSWEIFTPCRNKYIVVELFERLMQWLHYVSGKSWIALMKVRLHSFGKIQLWISDSTSLWSWCNKRADESLSRMDSMVPLENNDLSDLWSFILTQRNKLSLLIIN